MVAFTILGMGEPVYCSDFVFSKYSLFFNSHTMKERNFKNYGIKECKGGHGSTFVVSGRQSRRNLVYTLFVD